MRIDQKTFTSEALTFIEKGVEYDREDIAAKVACSLAKKLYYELGGVKAMSLMDVEHLSRAFYTAAKSLIEWTRCNRKVHPEEYADSVWRMPEERAMMEANL